MRVSPGLLAAVAAGHTVLAPNAELAAALFDAVERAHRDAGRDLWATPRILDFGNWLRAQYAQRQFADSASPRCLVDVEERELWRSVIDSSAARELLDPAAAARAARHARRTISEYGIPLRALADDPAEETHAFLDWNREFDERCRGLGCISADTLLGTMTDPPGAIAWIESPSWRPVARHWLQRHGQVLLPDSSAPESVFHMRAASQPEELAAIAHWAQTRLRADPRFRAWVCVPNLNRHRAQLIDAMDAALAPQRFTLHDHQGSAAYAVAGGTPLADYATVSIALQMLGACVSLVSFAQFSALLRAPQMQASDDEASATAWLDTVLRKRSPYEADLPQWLQLAERLGGANASAVAALQRLRRVTQALAQLRGNQPFSAWVPSWLAALEAGPWSQRTRWSSVEFQAAERFRELLAALATADRILGPQSRESALRVLGRAARDTAFQAQTGVPAVWVSGQLADPWLCYDGIWISGCTDDQWPAPAAPVALLPTPVQRQFGVPAAAPELQMKLAVDLQHRWALRAIQCVFSSAASREGRSNGASPILPKSAAILYPQTGALPLPRPHWRALFDNAPALEQWCDEVAPPFSPLDRTHGVASLRDQSRCAFRGFSQSRLLSEILEQPVPGFNEGERGKLVHAALEHIWGVLHDSESLQQLSPNSQQLLLDEAAVGAISLVCKFRDPGPRWQRRERVRLQQLLAKWLQVERGRAPFAVTDLESAHTAILAGLEFRVRIDRVDTLREGGRILLDYKTGAAHADWRGDRPHNPQLPIYAMLLPEALAAVAYGRVNARDAGFTAESQRRDLFKPGARASSLEGMPNFAALVQLWRRRIEALAEAFAAGRAEVAPTAKACQTCHLHALCRVPAALEDAQEAQD